jgi:hypothetical protein
MHDYRYDHVHLRSPDPDATARFFETMFGATSPLGGGCGEGRASPEWFAPQVLFWHTSGT